MFGVDAETHEYDEETDSLSNGHDIVRVHRIHRSERTRVARGVSLTPFLVFLAFEFTVLSTAFVLLLPTTLTEADMEQQKTILDSRVMSRSKLPGFAARWAAGVRVALVQLTRALIQDSAVFLTLFLLFTGVFVGSEHVKLDSYSSIEEMDDGSGISVTNI